MRTFLAINFKEEFKKKLYENFSICDENLKLVKKENLHLTLIFLGDSLNKDNISKMIDIMKNLEFKRFKLSLSTPGIFPNLEKPKVLWLGIDEGGKELNELYSFFYSYLIKENIKIENNFLPHITIARVKNYISKEKIAEFINQDFPELETDIESIDLMESKLNKISPSYFKIYSRQFL
jgi:2'-5' RNA ligase